MDIIINSDNNVESHADFKDYYRGEAESSLKRFDSHVTRFEVFFSDETSNKETPNDHKCVIEARPKGRDPERVSANGDTAKIAFDAAIGKIRTVLDRIVDQRRGY